MTMRICSLLPSGTEILYSLGLGDQVVAVTHECDYPPETAAKPRITEDLIEQGRMTSVEIDHHVSSNIGRHGTIYRLKQDLLETDRKSTRLNSSHVSTSYAVFCLKKKTTKNTSSTQACRPGSQRLPPMATALASPPSTSLPAPSEAPELPAGRSRATLPRPLPRTS